MVHKVFRVLLVTHKGSKVHRVLRTKGLNPPMVLQVLKVRKVVQLEHKVPKVLLKGLKEPKDPLQTRD
jgi:hypothetical protein